MEGWKNRELENLKRHKSLQSLNHANVILFTFLD